MYTVSQKKTVHFCFCQNFVKFPPILINFGRWMAKWLKLYAYNCVFSMTCPTSLHYLVKCGCYKFLPNTGFITIKLLRFDVKVKKTYCRDNFLSSKSLPDVQVVRGCFSGTAPRRIENTTPLLYWSERERDVRNALSSKRLCPCMGYISKQEF